MIRSHPIEILGVRKYEILFVEYSINVLEIFKDAEYLLSIRIKIYNNQDLKKFN